MIRTGILFSEIERHQRCRGIEIFAGCRRQIGYDTKMTRYAVVRVHGVGLAQLRQSGIEEDALRR